MIRRLALLMTTAVALLVATAAPAAAHVQLESSDPADGASLAAAPARVTLTFSGSVRVTEESIRITARDGSDWGVSSVEVDGGVVTAAVTPKGPAGLQGMTYRVSSDDGHTVSGTIRFTVAPPTTTVPTTTAPTTTGPTTTGPTTTEVSAAAQAGNTAPPEEGGSWPVWVWVLLAAALVPVGFLAFRARKSG